MIKKTKIIWLSKNMAPFYHEVWYFSAVVARVHLGNLRSLRVQEKSLRIGPYGFMAKVSRRMLKLGYVPSDKPQGLVNSRAASLGGFHFHTHWGEVSRGLLLRWDWGRCSHQKTSLHPVCQLGHRGWPASGNATCAEGASAGHQGNGPWLWG